MGSDSHRIFLGRGERVRRSDSAGVFCSNGGERGFAERHCSEFLHFQWSARGGTSDCGICNCFVWRRLVFLSEWAELCCSDRGVAHDEDREGSGKAGRRIATEEFSTGVPICDERRGGAPGTFALERVESLRIAIFSVHAYLRARYFERERQHA